MRDEYRCIEPEVGAMMHLLDEDDLEPETRRILEHHLRHCDHCRENREFERALRGLVAQGAVEVPLSLSPRRVAARVLAWAAPVAAALCIVIALFAAPSQDALLGGRDAGAHRGPTGAFAVTRPVDGEALGGGPVVLSWSPVDHASGFIIRVTQTDGDYAWTGEAADNRLALPADAPMPGEYLAVVEAVPEGIAPDGPAAVTFRRGRAGAVLAWRLNHLPRAAYWLALVALGLGVTAAVLRRL